VRLDLPEGVRIRTEPGGETAGLLPTGALLILLPETEVVNNQAWVRIQTQDGTQGWILEELTQRVTPTPGPPPGTPTPTGTATSAGP
jgi:hypothetical protein